MEDEVRSVAPPTQEVPMVEHEVVLQMRRLEALGWGAKRIARELEVSRNTVRRYLRGGASAESRARPGARALTDAQREEAARLLLSEAEGNAVVVHEMLAGQKVEASVRTVQRAVAPVRQQLRARQVATVRFESAPGKQMQVDFGEKKIRIGGQVVRVYLLVAVLSFSRRLFVKPFLAQRQGEWLEGIAEAFRHFGGIPAQLLMDNARALVLKHDRETRTVTFHPGLVAFARDFEVELRACAPYRARTKGKTESGVKYVKRNGIAGRAFESFQQLEARCAEFMVIADGRTHGTTGELPRERFEREERAALRALPDRPLAIRQRRLLRRVANDALIDVDTVRYSVPHRLVRERVEVEIAGDEVRIHHGGTLVARHRRGTEPRQRVVEPSHYDGLWRPASAAQKETSERLEEMGRTLADYARALGEAA